VKDVGLAACTNTILAQPKSNEFKKCRKPPMALERFAHYGRVCLAPRCALIDQPRNDIDEVAVAMGLLQNGDHFA
jgi:hypothetical protein